MDLYYSNLVSIEALIFLLASNHSMSVLVSPSSSGRWIFRSQDLAPQFSVTPAVTYKGETMVPPIYSIVSLFSSSHLNIPEATSREILYVTEKDTAAKD